MDLSPLRVASGVSAGGTGSDLDCFKHTRPSHGWLYMQGSLGQFDFPSQPAQLLERGERKSTWSFLFQQPGFGPS